jgi:hypothetical protein
MSHANAVLLYPCDIKCASVLAVSLPEEISCGLIPVACIEIFFHGKGKSCRFYGGKKFYGLHLKLT